MSVRVTGINYSELRGISTIQGVCRHFCVTGVLSAKTLSRYSTAYRGVLSNSDRSHSHRATLRPIVKQQCHMLLLQAVSGDYAAVTATFLDAVVPAAGATGYYSTFLNQVRICHCLPCVHSLVNVCAVYTMCATSH